MTFEDQLNAFREITLNMYMGHLIVFDYYRTKLKKYKNLIQSLCDRGVSNSALNDYYRKTKKWFLWFSNPTLKTMAEKYLLVKKPTYDRMKKKQSEKERKPSCDQGVNTEETLATIFNQKDDKSEPIQSGSGLIYVGNGKRKATSPPGVRTPKKRKTMWLTF